MNFGKMLAGLKSNTETGLKAFLRELTGGYGANYNIRVAAAGAAISFAAGARMYGLAGLITPVTSGTVLFLIQASVFNDTLNDGVRAQMYYGSGAAPANGDFTSGTNIGGAANHSIQSAANQLDSVTCIGIGTGLVLGTTYWFDLALQSLVGGNSNISGVVGLSAIEI